MSRTNEEQVEFMQRMLSSYAKVHTDRYWNEINSHISNMIKGKVLDIGCGPGLLLKDVYTRYDPKYLYALDLSSVMLDKAKEVLSDAYKAGKLSTIKQHMQEDMKLPNDLDVIFSSRVLRSFNDQWGVMKSIYNSLNNDGLLVLLDWSKASIYTYEKYFIKTGNFSIEPEDVINYHRNFSRYDIDDWEYILTKVGFQIVHAFQLGEVHNCIIAKKSK